MVHSRVPETVRPEPVEPETVQYVQAPALVRDYAGSAFVLSESAAEPLALRGSAREIWLEFAQAATLDAVAARLDERFEGSDLATIRRDVAALVQQLVDCNVLEVA